MTMSERFACVALMEDNQMLPKIKQTNMQRRDEREKIREKCAEICRDRPTKKRDPRPSSVLEPDGEQYVSLIGGGGREMTGREDRGDGARKRSSTKGDRP